MKSKIFIFLIFISSFGCAGPNPNSGERTADIAMLEGNFARTLEIAQYNAEKGYPWAQLRLGYLHKMGNGVPEDIDKALLWFKKAAAQTAEGAWADGQLIGASGEYGYFNQNGDALIAQYNIGQIYSEEEYGRKDLVEAFKWAKSVVEQSNGKNLFYCCEFSGGYSLSQQQIQDLLKNIEKQMTENQKNEALKQYDIWKPKKPIKYQS